MDRFRSPRGALAYMYSCKRGPSARRPLYTDRPPEFRGHHLTHVLIGAMLYGPKENGLCGVVRCSEADREVYMWAVRCGPRTPAVRSVERRMRSLMREHGIKDEGPVLLSQAWRFMRWVDCDNVSWSWIEDDDKE